MLKPATTHAEPTPIGNRDGDKVVCQFIDDVWVIRRVNNVYVRPGAQRAWFYRECTRYNAVPYYSRYGNSYCNETGIHPAVLTALDNWGYPRPDPSARYNARTAPCLLLEVPHIPTGDKHGGDRSMVAFTETDQKGQQDRQTVISVSKYLTRHWPLVPAHLIRDMATKFGPDSYAIWDTLPNIIRSIEDGPRSCMKTSYHGGRGHPFWEELPAFRAWLKATLANPDDPTLPDIESDPDWEKHMYGVYNPEHGWGAAVRLDSQGRVLGRAIVYRPKKLFVRTYSRRDANVDDDSNSGSDHGLESWLKEQGYDQRHRWPEGVKFDRLDHPRFGGVMMPYLDGSNGSDRWARDVGHYVVKIDEPEDSDSDVMCDCTDGETTEYEDERERCADCGEPMGEDETYTVGRSENRQVCCNCIDSYTEVRAYSRWSSYREYYIDNDDAVEVEGREYCVDPDNLPDDIVRGANDLYYHRDDTVCIDGDYYHEDDDDIVHLHELDNDGNWYALRDDAWEDAEGNWHSDDYEYITYGGKKYLKDDAWVCEATGLWYPDVAESAIDPETGDTVHPDWLQPCSRQADFIIRYDEDIAFDHAQVPPVPVPEERYEEPRREPGVEVTTCDLFALAA